MRSVKLDSFVLLLAATIILAKCAPEIERIIPLDKISLYGISGIFFFYGMKLDPKKMKKGLSNWKLHILIQSSTFMLFPLLLLVLLPFIEREAHFTLWMSVFFLATLPSTVSSSVVMVSIAKGNIPGAIFNASISGLIGIVVTPLWMGLFLESRACSFDLGQTFLELMLKILLPVILGMILHPLGGKLADRKKKYLTMFDKTVILIIVYKSFSNSFSSGVFMEIRAVELFTVGIGVIALFFMVYYLILLMSKWLNFKAEDEITALFCGSKKSLVHGTVFSSVLFSGMDSSGIFLVPIMIYHAFQLFIISIIAQKYQSDAR